MKIMSVTSYAKMKGVSRQYILKCIKKGKALDGVKNFYKMGDKTSHYILEME